MIKEIKMKNRILNLINAKALVLMVLLVPAALSAYYIPQNLIDKVNNDAPIYYCDTLWKEIITEFEPRLNALDSNDALVSEYLERMRSKIYTAYFLYNNNTGYNRKLYHYRGAYRLQENLGFYLTALEADVDPALRLPGTRLSNAYVTSGNSIGYYDLTVPKKYNAAVAHPVTFLNQMSPCVETMVKFSYITVYGYSGGAKETLKDAAKYVHINPFRTYATSHSQGGQVLFEQVLSHPHRYAAISPVANSTRDPIRNETYVRVPYLVNVPIRLVCGKNDWFYHDNFELFQMLSANGGIVDYLFTDTDHGGKWFIDSSLFSLLLDHMDKYVLYPYPDLVVKDVKTTQFSGGSINNYTRAYWINGLLNKSYSTSEKPLEDVYYRISADRASNTITIEHSDLRFSGFEFFLNDSLMANMTLPVKVISQDGDTVFNAVPPGDGKITVHLYDISSIPSGLPLNDRDAQYVSNADTILMWEELRALETQYFNATTPIPGRPPTVGTREGLAKDWSKDVRINVYPNPFKTSVKIFVRRTSHVARHEVRLEVFNIAGKMVANIKPPATSDQRLATSYTWHSQNHPSGVYLVKVELGNRILTKKIMLQR
jgi:hypothetical protein